jgi:hypothetical protein
MERLCSILRRRLSDLETRLPTLLEAQMLAVAGNSGRLNDSHLHFARLSAANVWPLLRSHSDTSKLSGGASLQLWSGGDGSLAWDRSMCHIAQVTHSWSAVSWTWVPSSSIEWTCCLWAMVPTCFSSIVHGGCSVRVTICDLTPPTGRGL